MALSPVRYLTLKKCSGALHLVLFYLILSCIRVCFFCFFWHFFHVNLKILLCFLFHKLHNRSLLIVTQNIRGTVLVCSMICTGMIC